MVTVNDILEDFEDFDRDLPVYIKDQNGNSFDITGYKLEQTDEGEDIEITILAEKEDE